MTPVTDRIEETEKQAPAVPCDIVIHQRADGGLSGPLGMKLRIAQRGLNAAAVRPDAVGHQRSVDARAPPSDLALIERHHNGREQRDRRRVVAEAGGGLDRLGIAVVHAAHQAAAGPVSGRVVARFFGVVAVFAIAGDGGVDEAVVQRREVLRK